MGGFDMNELSTVLITIISSIIPLLGGGVIIFRKQNKRIKNAEALLAEVNVDKARVETKAEDWHIWKEQAEMLSEQNKALIERNSAFVQMNAEKEDRHLADIKDWESRFDKAVDRTREVQRENAELHEKIVQQTKKIGDLELELQKNRCETYDCPFREPPTADTPPKAGMTKEKYFKTKAK